jgi:glycosyltransferase involved in cell wall biosynthesis
MAGPLRIAIDASRTTVTRVTGTEHYAIRLIQSIIAHNPGHAITLYFRDAPPDGLFPDDPPVTIRVIPFRRAWTHLRFAWSLWRDRPDVTFVPAHTLPFIFPGRAVVTVHDLGYRPFPEAHPPRQWAYLELSTRFSARRATRILADSIATAADLTRYYGTKQDKIQVVYPGVETPAVSDIDVVRSKYDLPSQYYLFIGTLQPRKNIAAIAAAYARYREAVPEPVGLVLAGGEGWLYDPDWVAGIDGVTLTGYIDEADKGALYAGALALVFPSLYEGFGFPVVEAMGCGTPVITSTTSSLPELAGDAGLLVDPTDEEAITRAMIRMHDDASLRTRLIALGRQKAASFTWDRAAQQALAALETAAAH